jgi:hypothetical protein
MLALPFRKSSVPAPLLPPFRQSRKTEAKQGRKKQSREEGSKAGKKEAKQGRRKQSLLLPVLPAKREARKQEGKRLTFRTRFRVYMS